ncbi:hypothetical protein ACWGHM_21825 [Streptomyces sp. NPDC054904]|uniref:hypothetical protein n=1 Tax=unclassified Streptomyces TaxID=2593676 RepID=UPI002481EE9F|nr:MULTISPECIES: hypothetical protein [unclassified Streptomyces]MDA5284393.1 hypothetical protein [Streptomyces sp. Isolate_45]MDX2394794.1 hypothetical protein [Streptomyces sp. DK15]
MPRGTFGRRSDRTGNSSPAPVRNRAVRREARRAVRSMPLPHPFSTASLISAIEAERGRRIELVTAPDSLLGQSDVCGLWVHHERLLLDLIFIPESISGYHRQRVVFHELAHLWCDDPTTQPGQAAALLPELSPELTARLTEAGPFMARHRYDTHVERRAEMIADLLHEEAFASDRIEDGTLRGLDDTLSRPFSRPARSGLV